ncbi:hypothetical protein L596_018524 [Steinernema carpocapsae]|uniref:Small-subunit processome Utp12 domain-containing protein n=1 Tax=Steinernema carpocapsae TaxID=34508 RepID=A0A4U5N5M3_STECR|nr:hypothetical protein L596_018524 [Steinernema carpocapsae]
MNNDFRFSDLLGSVYKNGNITFSGDGNSVISPVGNKIKCYDLKNNHSTTFSFDSAFNIQCIALNPSGTHAFYVNEVGAGVYVNLETQTVLHRHRFGEVVRCVRFSPNGKRLAVCTMGEVFVFNLHSIKHTVYNPFVLETVYKLTSENVTTVSWSDDSIFLAAGSEDKRAFVMPASRIYANCTVHSLGSQKGPVVGAFFFKGSYDLITIDQRGGSTHWGCNITKDDLVKKLDVKDLTDETQFTKIYYSKIERTSLNEHSGSGKSVNITACDFHAASSILAVGFGNGTFLIMEMPSYNLIQSFNIAEVQLNSIAFNNTGDWIGLACGRGSEAQLVVWEWQSETYIMKQQSHEQTITTIQYSPDGAYLATGAEDGKVKIWNCRSSFCVVTFSDHTRGVSAICWTQSGKAILSASLDGTVRANDMKRYRNFRTLVCPEQTQLGTLCTDDAGELVMASSRHDFQIYVWSLENGRLLDVLNGHTAPITALFSHQSTLASVAHDKTLRVWNIVQGGSETITLTDEGLDVAYSPCGFVLAALSLGSVVTLFHTTTSAQIGSIEAQRDLEASRYATDSIKKSTSEKNKSFTRMAFSPDGSMLLLGGQSNYFCLYNVAERLILKKFRLTRNYSLDGVSLDVNFRKLTEYGNMELFDGSDSEDENGRKRIKLPGTRHSDLSERVAKPVMKVNALHFNPTGRSFAVSSTEGIHTYSSDILRLFDPFELSVDITPEKIHEAAMQGELKLALTMALRLNDAKIIKQITESIPVGQISITVRGMQFVYAERLLKWMADTGAGGFGSALLHFYQIWVKEILRNFAPQLKQNVGQNLSTLVGIQETSGHQAKWLTKLCDQNLYQIGYLKAVYEISGVKLDPGKIKEKEEAEKKAAKAARNAMKAEQKS